MIYEINGLWMGVDGKVEQRELTKPNKNIYIKKKLVHIQNSKIDSLEVGSY